MRIYSVSELTQTAEVLLRSKGLDITRVLYSRGIVEGRQQTGKVSQSFRITVENLDKD